MLPKLELLLHLLARSNFFLNKQLVLSDSIRELLIGGIASKRIEGSLVFLIQLSRSFRVILRAPLEVLSVPLLLVLLRVVGSQLEELLLN